MSGLGALRQLFHGGRKFLEWDPRTIKTGEGMLAQGPGLYAASKPEVAKMYLKYGGESPTLSSLLVDDSRIFNPASKMTPEHKGAYLRAEALLDELGLKASSYGIRNALLNRSYNPDTVRRILSDSGIAGFYQPLAEGFGDEFVIFDPKVIKSIQETTGFKKGGLAQVKKEGGLVSDKRGACGRLCSACEKRATCDKGGCNGR